MPMKEVVSNFAIGRFSQHFATEAGHEVTEEQLKLILLSHHLALFLTFALALGSQS
jgi:hypothetical protein